jgi:large subunit ribosomal protein L30
VAKGELKISQRRSAAGANRRQRETLRSLGLRGIGTSVDRADSPQLRGMLSAVDHLIEVSSDGSKKGSDG